MKLLLIYWSFLIAGYITGSRLNAAGKRFHSLPSLMMVTVYCLCFVMGLRMGVNEQVTSNLGTIGLQALLITFCSIAGSLLFIFGTRKLLRIDRYGDRIGERIGGRDDGQIGERTGGRDDDRTDEESGRDSGGQKVFSDRTKAGLALRERGGDAAEGQSGGSTADENSGLDVKSTLILLSVVAAGMLIGALILARLGTDFLIRFDSGSNLAMVILLCILMSFVGLDMGSSGDVLRNLRSTGLRMMVFPFVTIIGTMVFGMGICLILGFSLRESAAIPLGFGWYSYAPIVIAGAGEQYIVTSAVSFMHNVIREVTGIIMIPVVAKTIGYLEATGVAGIADMDVCIPIVERSCRTDTVILSFATGIIMCFATSLGVPLVMGV